jgi:hypothetical protein
MEKYSLQLSTSKADLANTRIDPREDLLCLDSKALYSRERDTALLKQSHWSEEALQLKRIGIRDYAWAPRILRDLFRKFKMADEVMVTLNISCCQLKGGT